MDIKRSIKSGWLTNTLLQYIRIYMNIHFSLKKKIISLQFHFTLIRTLLEIPPVFHVYKSNFRLYRIFVFKKKLSRYISR